MSLYISSCCCCSVHKGVFLLAVLSFLGWLIAFFLYLFILINYPDWFQSCEILHFKFEDKCIILRSDQKCSQGLDFHQPLGISWWQFSCDGALQEVSNYSWFSTAVDCDFFVCYHKAGIDLVQLYSMTFLFSFSLIFITVYSAIILQDDVKPLAAVPGDLFVDDLFIKHLKEQFLLCTWCNSTLW